MRCSQMTIPQKSLNVSLTPELATFIQARVASGRYQSASEVVRAALRLLERDEASWLARDDEGTKPASDLKPNRSSHA